MKLGERNAILFDKNAIRATVQSNDDDEVLEPTIEQLREHIDDLKKIQEGKPLTTAEQRALDKAKRREAKIARFPKVQIRVQFPNRYVLQGEFSPEDTIGHVAEFVRPYLADSEIKFNLCRC